MLTIKWVDSPDCESDTISFCATPCRSEDGCTQQGTHMEELVHGEQVQSIRFDLSCSQSWIGMFDVGGLRRENCLTGNLTRQSWLEHTGTVVVCKHVEVFPNSALAMVYLNGNVYWVDALERKVVSVGHFECDEQDIFAACAQPIFNSKHRLILRDREVEGLRVYSAHSSCTIDSGVLCCPQIMNFDDDFIYYEGCSGLRTKVNLRSLEVEAA